MSFASADDDPLQVVERRRQSPLGLSAPVGMSEPERSDGLNSRRSSAQSIAEGLKPANEVTAPANRRDDLFRANKALDEAGEPPSADRAPDARGIANRLKGFQERNGLKPDGIANPGGPTDRRLDNIRRRRRRLVEQRRAASQETLADRVAVFQEAHADRRATANDDFTALKGSRRGRLHILSLAGTADETKARPIVQETLDRLCAERATPPDDGSRPLPDDGEEKPKPPAARPPDDGSRPGPDDEKPGDDEDPDDEEDDKKKPDPCADEARDVAAKKESVESLEEELSELQEKETAVREEIKHYEKSASRHERNAEREDEQYDQPSALDLPLPSRDKKGRPKKPSWVDLAIYAFKVKPLNLGESRSIAERYRRYIRQLRDELSFIQQAKRDVRIRLHAARKALKDARAVLADCRAQSPKS